MSQDNPLLTPEQLADRWQVSDSTLRRWRCLGRGPGYIKLGSGEKDPVRYPLAEVERYEAAMKIETE